MTSASDIPPIVAKQGSFVSDTLAIAVRSIRQLPRDLASVVPAFFIPLFFLVVNVGSLGDAAEFSSIEISYQAFQLPVSIVFAVTGVSRAPALVIDIQNGYFDRLMTTPVSRRALLLGHMLADFVLVVCLCIPVVILGFIIGVTFASGPLGVLMFIFIGAAWGLAFTGIPYSIALKTGNPGAVNSSFLIFFPFAFLTTAYLPLENMTGWLASVARYNPVTYLLAGLRSLFVGWDPVALLQAFAAIAVLGLFSQTLSFRALKGRVTSK